jgi:hypothetical protein
VEDERNNSIYDQEWEFKGDQLVAPEPMPTTAFEDFLAMPQPIGSCLF